MNELSHEAVATGPEIVEHLDTLLSLYFDNCLSDEQFSELSGLLASDPKARERTFEMAQLHADLSEFFRGEKTPIAPPLPPIGGLATAGQPIG